MNIKSPAALNSFKLVLTSLSFLFMASTNIFAQEHTKSSPIFSITKMQDGSENGTDVVYIIKMTDELGNDLINTTNTEIILDIEFGIDSDATRSDMRTAFPSSIAIDPKSAKTTLRLEVLNDDVTETPESLVAMIYNPSIGKISEINDHAVAIIYEGDGISFGDNTNGFSNNRNTSKIEIMRRSSVITMFLN